MIKSFNSKETKKVWDGFKSAKLPDAIQETARRKLRMLNNSVDLKDLTIPPSNRFEKLKGDLKDYYSIRINDRWRITFKWNDGHSYCVDIIDYH